ncbi:hypothetical protein PDO_2278 [Rhizobium sp. PDO1-076]|uniref:DUF2934 domain-containing protein n=1 Tax=Rhizobium sp. PDO1-076 TaxID=1125979 RepID=UPI00024E35F5|nr:DUF2934 domain-containing protein [Rhizobium sp. PDO1-076]EHS50806.1 hypothetical protein PDO_2278 [Rhizobium sp. PDO1-076]
MSDRDTDKDNDWIARRAYSRWEEEGRPHGRDADHWHAALQDWQMLQAASDRTVDNAGQRIADAQASAFEDNRTRDPSPAQPQTAQPQPPRLVKAVKAPKR